jgi:hypothetical protein
MTRKERRKRNRYHSHQVDVYNDPYYTPESYSGSEDEGTETRTVRVLTTAMVIHSQHLINALQAVVAYYPYVNLTGKSVTIEAPYRVLIHHREALEKYRDNQPSCHSAEYATITASHIDTLLEFLERDMGSKIRAEQVRHRYNTPMATFENFWLLLKPGEVLFAKRDDILVPFIISSVTRPPTMDSRPPNYQVNCWYLECSNNRMSRFTTSYTVPPWTGEQAIQSLEVIPATFYPEDLVAQGGMTAMEEQIKLGKLYWDLLKKVSYMDYDGLLVSSSNANIPMVTPSGYVSFTLLC